MAATGYGPDIIAQSFIKQYYEVLANKPELLYRFYKEDSNFSFCEGPVANEVAVGVVAISTKVKEVGFSGTQVDLSEGSIDAQKSDVNSILILVTGKFSLPEKDPRHFVQTFILVAQGAGTSFYCRNSVLRLLAPVSAPAPVVEAPVATPQPVQVQQPVATPQPEPVVAKVEPVQETQPAPAPTPAPTPVSAPVVEEQVEEEEEEVEEEVVVETVVIVETVVEPEPVPSGPRSWLDIAKKNSAVASPAPAAAPRGFKTVKSTSTETATAAAKTTTAPAKKQNAPAGPKQFTLFVSKIPADALLSEIEELFGSFGVNTVKSVDFNVERGYAFVEIDGESPFKTILSHASGDGILLKGTALKVEEKRPAARKPNGNGAKPSTGPRNTNSAPSTATGEKSEKKGPRRDKNEKANTEGGEKPQSAEGKKPRPRQPKAAATPAENV